MDPTEASPKIAPADSNKKSRRSNVCLGLVISPRVGRWVSGLRSGVVISPHCLQKHLAGGSACVVTGDHIEMELAATESRRESHRREKTLTRPMRLGDCSGRVLGLGKSSIISLALRTDDAELILNQHGKGIVSGYQVVSAEICRLDAATGSETAAPS